MSSQKVNKIVSMAEIYVKNLGYKTDIKLFADQYRDVHTHVSKSIKINYGDPIYYSGLTFILNKKV